MIGEHVFGFSDFGIDPLSEGAKDRLFTAVHEKRQAMKASREAKKKHILVGSIWSRGYDYYFEVYPTASYEDA